MQLLRCRADRQIDRQTDRQTGGQADRQTDRHTVRQTDRLYSLKAACCVSYAVAFLVCVRHVKIPVHAAGMLTMQQIFSSIQSMCTYAMLIQSCSCVQVWSVLVA